MHGGNAPSTLVAQQLMPFALAFWGDKYGKLTEPCGITWAISSPNRS